MHPTKEKALINSWRTRSGLNVETPYKKGINMSNITTSQKNVTHTVDVISHKSGVLVLCAIYHFVINKNSIDQLRKQIKSKLHLCIVKAGAKCQTFSNSKTCISIGFDVGDKDPSISINIFNPVLCLERFDFYFEKMMAAVSRFFANEIVIGA